MMRIFILFCFTASLFGETIETFYGVIEVQEPVLLDLIHSPAFERLRGIHQYGVSYYTGTHLEEYNRFDHSLGVFALLREKGACLEEQIAGLLHDISHTVFSHVGDWVFDKKQQEDDYQSMIHHFYLAVSGIEAILHRYGYTIEQVLPKRKEFAMLEQPLPDLCADRIDYNIQGAYFQKFLSREEAQHLFHNLVYEEGKWVISDQKLAEKLACFSLFMTENCWGNAINLVTSQWLADALIQGLKIGLISWYEFHFGIDQDIWDQLARSTDPLIQERVGRLTSPDHYCHIVDPAQATDFLKFKCRGIDPWIRQESLLLRLSTLNPSFATSLQTLKKLASTGWPVEISE